MAMAKEQVKFKFKGYRIVNSEINIARDGEIDKGLSVTFSPVNSSVEDSVYILDLGTEIINEDNSINIKLEMRGFFEFDQELPEEQKAVFFIGSAPAIMFPYLRAYISTLTSISGIEPIILPTINFSEGLRRANKD